MNCARWLLSSIRPAALAAGPTLKSEESKMKRNISLAVALVAAFGLAGCQMFKSDTKESSASSASTYRSSQGEHVSLSGKNEVPANDSSASGTGMVSVTADGAVKVHVTVKGMEATAAHIHVAAAGANGPV